MNNNSDNNSSLSPASFQNRLVSFVWQHVLLIISLFFMTLGVALCVRSALGSSVISAIPLAMTLAGQEGLAPDFSIGDYTNMMNIALVMLQILILRRRFEPVQLFQLIIGFFFGWLLDLNMALTSPVDFSSLPMQIFAQIFGCIILGFGIAAEIRCGSVTMPGEGISVAVCRALNIPFPKAKIGVDISLVVIAVVLCLFFFHTPLAAVTGPGTLFAMIFVGYVVKLLNPHMSWFDRVLHYRPGIKRSVYGLLRFLTRRNGK